MPAEAAEVLDQAIAKVRTGSDEEIPDWRALEFLAAEFLGQ
jgi:hypothetical protein